MAATATLEAAPAALAPIDPAWAWAPYAPDAARPWDLARAGHLFRRAGFGAGWTELKQALADGPAPTIDRLLAPQADVAAFSRAADQEEASAASGNATDGLRAWWLRRMIQSPHPLLEKMTLFWHGHLAVGNRGVADAGLMSGYVQLLRTHALGRFDALLAGVLQDAAVFGWLDAKANRKARPSTAYARNVLECYTVGPGQFTDGDVAALARSMTGWFVLTNRLRFTDREHDQGLKRLCGQEGNFGAVEAAGVLAKQPATARHIVRRLYGFLISETELPSDALIGPLADSFAADCDTAKVVGTMLRSNLFHSPTAYRQRVKGPVEYALGIVKGLEGMIGTSKLGEDLAGLGQNLYNPPTAHGWAGGKHWISRATVLGRANVAAAMLTGGDAYGDHLNPTATLDKHGASSPEAAAKLLADVLCDGDVPAEVQSGLVESARQLAKASPVPAGWARQLVHQVVTLPEYQLS